MQAVPTASARLAFRLNDRSVDIDPAATSTTLLEFIRGRGLTGAKEGCAEGECGACTVALVAPTSQGSTYLAVNSCLVLLPTMAGHEVYTVEAIAENGRLSSAQEAMAAAGGSQCGYCTPGFVVSLFVEIPRPCTEISVAAQAIARSPMLLRRSVRPRRACCSTGCRVLPRRPRAWTRRPSRVPPHCRACSICSTRIRMPHSSPAEPMSPST
jgi:aerobic-type carbon monoxide dehydrogenase small subunit (CoxS/CutS family)